MGLHTGEPHVGDEGYVGMDVVRAARICSAGHGGQILVSETTRALVGNDLPEGVSVRDLGKQNLKDVQREHVYELALGEAPEEFPPLKSRPGDSFEQRFERRIEEYVESQIEKGFSGDAAGVGKVAATGLGLAAGGILIFLLLVAGIILLVKLAL